MSLAEIRNKLDKKYSLQQEDSEKIIYTKGEFAGFPIKQITLSIENDRMTRFLVMYDKMHPFPKSQIFDIIRKKMSSKWGPPDSYNPYPGETKLWGDSVFLMLDTSIEDGEWVPLATWKFNNNAISTMKVTSQKARLFQERLQVSWEFSQNASDDDDF